MRRFLAVVVAILIGPAAAFAPSSWAQSPPKVLSARDADTYAAAFSAVKQGRFDALDDIKGHVHDPCLIGRLTYIKLMHPDYHAEFDELKAWLAKYRDQPDADKVYALAKKRRPGSALEPVEPGGETPTGMALVPTDGGDLAKPKSAVAPKVQAAREAFYNDGDVATAFALATKSGERWVGGMAAYRLGRYSTAVERFASLSRDQTQNEWVRSGAAFWAARSSIAAGEPREALEYLRVAARTPYTFYGLIAERQLGLEPAVKSEGLDMGGEDGPAAGGVVPMRRPATEPLAPKVIAKFVKTDKRAKRAAAYIQIGQRSEAGEELRLALSYAGSEPDRRKWRALGDDLGIPLGAPVLVNRHSPFDVSGYPTPDLAPVGGYTLERALVYAIIRQESRFNASAASSAGAYGLMQMTPATAAYNAGVSPNSIDSSLLLDPGTNMRLGQDYVARLLDQTQGDILRTVAAYNAGPRGINKLAAALPDADSLLLIESLAGAETREFVQRVMSNYWIYRQLFSQPAPTLDATAAGSKTILAAWDQTAAALDAPASATPPSAPDPTAVPSPPQAEPLTIHR
jgi:soluble lytic murein transglycosylase-like protein